MQPLSEGQRAVLGELLTLPMTREELREWFPEVDSRGLGRTVGSLHHGHGLLECVGGKYMVREDQRERAKRMVRCGR